MKMRTGSEKSGWVSIEAVVGISIAALTFIIFGLIFLAQGERSEAGGQRSEVGNRKAARLRPHEAVALVSSAPTSSATEGVKLDEGEEGTSSDGVEFDDQRTPPQQNDPTTIVRDGVTVVTPHLLVPVVKHMDFLDQRAEPLPGADATAGPTLKPSHRRSSYAARTSHHRRGHVEYRIVGLAAGRRVVAVAR